MVGVLDRNYLVFHCVNFIVAKGYRGCTDKTVWTDMSYARMMAEYLEDLIDMMRAGGNLTAMEVAIDLLDDVENKLAAMQRELRPRKNK